MASNFKAIEPGPVLLDWAHSEPVKLAPIRQALASACSLSIIPEEADVAAIVGSRHFLLAFFLLNRTEWFEADVTLSELSAARTVNCFDPKYPRTVAGVLHDPQLQAPEGSVGVPLVGRPTLVATSNTATPCLIDGYHRSTEMIRRHVTGPIPVYWGICPNLLQWRWWK